MNEFIQEMRVGRRTSLLQFQKGILLCNRSLQQMFSYLQELYSSETFEVKYILTNRLNQDVLENFFSYLRSMGAGYDHPTPVEIQYRLKWYILGKHSGYVLSIRQNTEGDNTCDSLITMADVHSPLREKDPMSSFEQTIEEDIFTENCPLWEENDIDITGEEHSIQEENGEGRETNLNTSVH